jgi:hypothetical protein
LPEQRLLTGHGNSALLEHCLHDIERARITADQLPQIPKGNGEDHEARKIPLALQAAINSVGPYPGGHRTPVTASIIWWLFDRGFDADEIKERVEGRGPFLHYKEKKSKLTKDIERIRKKWAKANPDKGEEQTPLPMQSTMEFVSNFTPPDYLIDGLIQRRFIYSMTGPTGEGKTGVTLFLALCVDQGWTLDGREIDKGKVLYCAGENPDDVRMRWIKQLDDAKIDPQTCNVHFIPGGFSNFR